MGSSTRLLISPANPGPPKLCDRGVEGHADAVGVSCNLVLYYVKGTESEKYIISGSWQPVKLAIFDLSFVIPI